jgi:putative transposase
MCEVLQVSTSGYYAWINRQPSPRAVRHERIRQAVREVHAASRGVYGSHKVAKKLLNHDDLETACRNTVASAMREMG